MKIRHTSFKRALTYGALTLFVFLSTFLSTHHNHAFGEVREDCPAYILNFTFHSVDDISFATQGTVLFYHHTFLTITDEKCLYTVFYTSETGRSPPCFPSV